MIGRTLTVEAAAALRARFMTDDPKTPAEMLTVATGSTKSIDLGMGLSLERRRVAGEGRSSRSKCGCLCRMGMSRRRWRFWRRLVSLHSRPKGGERHKLPTADFTMIH